MYIKSKHTKYGKPYIRALARATARIVIDPVCNMTVDESTAAATSFNGAKHYFCSPTCKKAFDSHPERYLSRERK